MNQKPLTAQDLAEALGCFSNAAIGAMHNGTHAVACIAQGIDAVVWRLQEIAESGKPAPAPSVAAPADPALRPTPQLSGDACTNCGNFSLVRSGTCMTCQACGETTGCS